MKLTLRTYYAVLALASLVETDPSEERRHRVEEIAKQRGISESFLLQVFQDLKKAGLVNSKRGTNGGYSLNRPAETITLAQIIECVEGPILPTPSEERKSGEWPRTAWKGLDRIWDELRHRVCRVAEEYTLDRIAAQLNAEETQMYYI